MVEIRCEFVSFVFDINNLPEIFLTNSIFFIYFSINIWYSHNGELLGTLVLDGAVFSVDINPTTTLLATGSGDGYARLFNIKTGKLLYSWKTTATPRHVAFSPNGDKLLIVTDENFGVRSSLRIYNLNTKIPDSTDENATSAKEGQSPSETPATIQSDEPVIHIIAPEKVKYVVADWAYDGKHIVAGLNNGTITRNNVEESSGGKVLSSQKVHDQSISDLQTSLDRTYFITSSRDKTAKLFDIDTLKHLKTYEGQAPINSAAITTVKDFVILGGGQDAGSVTTTSSHEGDFKSKIFHKVFEDMIGEVKGHFGPINTLATDPKGRSFASGGEDGFIRLHHFDKSYYDFYYDIELRKKEEIASAAADAAAAAATSVAN